eukprot:Gregarina_sp_Poly_1__9853@NODE_636_length_7024_cov_22_198074_g485_i0_p1_GENE_NODE_636_length_7024_cov_22_198074_g485_i0NODE_636_length_7024_cov_22_198074_g485_i0_p1_ORF_typecomplete_len729_score114_09PHM7_cyt/PF14703_6/0_04Syntaxin_2/PF14523_6/1_6e03Syntaxin_2/PF14523_6/1_8Syntaxin_2/PF14523_6/64_NODE_636_length_7024_cov_22_198074_g485_i044666652
MAKTVTLFKLEFSLTSKKPGMKGVTVRQSKPGAANVLLWRCLVGCGHAILINSEDETKNVLVCQSDDKEKHFSLFCENLELCQLDIKDKGLSKTEINDSLQLLPFAGSGYVSVLQNCQNDLSWEYRPDDSVILKALRNHLKCSLPLGILTEASKAWHQFLRREEIIETRKKFQNQVSLETIAEVPELTMDGGAKQFVSEGDFLEHIADRFVDQFSQVCRSAIRKKESEAIMMEFQKLQSILLVSNASTANPDEYENFLSEFLKHLRFGSSNGVGAYSRIEALVGKGLSPTSMAQFLPLCDDALEKAKTVYIDDFNFEPLIMRLAYMRTTALLSLIFKPGLEKYCKNHRQNENVKEAERKLKDIKTLTNRLSQAWPCYHRSSKEWTAERRKIVLDISQSMQSFDPFKHCVTCKRDDFEGCFHKLKKLSQQLEEMNALQNSNKQKFGWHTVGFPQGLQSAWQLFWQGLVSPCENWTTNRVHSIAFEKVPEKIPEAVRSSVRCALIELVPHQFLSEEFKPNESDYQECTEAAPLFGPNQVYQLQRWILTEATQDEALEVLKTLSPLLNALELRINKSGIENASTCGILQNGLKFSEMVASILTLCNSIAMTSSLDSENRSTMYNRLWDSVRFFDKLETMEGRFLVPNLFKSVSRRFQFRSFASGSDCSEVLKLLARLEKWCILTGSKGDELEACALLIDLEEAKIKTTQFVNEVLPKFRFGRSHLLKEVIG